MAVQDLRPGHIIGATGVRTITTRGVDHGTYWSYVVRYTNGEYRIESWDTGTTIPVTGVDRDLSRHENRLRAVPPAH